MFRLVKEERKLSSFGSITQIYKIIFVELWYFWCCIYIKYVIRFNIFLSEKKDFGFFVFCFVQCNNVLFIHIDFNIYF